MNEGAQKLIAIVGVILLAGVFFIAATTKREATSQDTEGSGHKVDGAWPAPESELLNPVLLSRYLGQPYAATRAHIYKDCFSRVTGGCFYSPDLEATTALKVHVNDSENTGFVRHIFWQAYSPEEGPATRDLLQRVEGTLPCKRSDWYSREREPGRIGDRYVTARCTSGGIHFKADVHYSWPRGHNRAEVVMSLAQ